MDKYFRANEQVFVKDKHGRKHLGTVVSANGPYHVNVRLEDYAKSVVDPREFPDIEKIPVLHENLESAATKRFDLKEATAQAWMAREEIVECLEMQGYPLSSIQAGQMTNVLTHYFVKRMTQGG